MKNRIAQALIALGYLFVRNHVTSLDSEGDYRFTHYQRGPVQFWTREGRIVDTASLLVRIGEWDLLYVNEAHNYHQPTTYRIVGVERRPEF